MGILQIAKHRDSYAHAESPKGVNATAGPYLGVEIGDHIGLKNLDEPGMITFLHHCADVGAAVLVNPWDMMAGDCLTEDMMPWTVDMPAETQLLVAMIEGGAFDRLPHSLRICFAHGGGSLPF
jgi:aminocarboxymuconate-semialdehyde decarboxylase